MRKKTRVSRRTVIAAAFVPVSSLRPAPKAGLTPQERKILEAFADRLIPHDDHGPSATEAGAVEYIDRSSLDYLAPEKPILQKNLQALDAYAQRAFHAPFNELKPAQQDEVLTALESNKAEGFDPDARTFFQRIRQLALEGMFGDPFYGGNRAFAGWDLIRYPGPRLAVGPDEQKIGVEIKPVRASAHGGAHGH